MMILYCILAVLCTAKIYCREHQQYIDDIVIFVNWYVHNITPIFIKDDQLSLFDFQPVSTFPLLAKYVKHFFCRECLIFGLNTTSFLRTIDFQKGKSTKNALVSLEFDRCGHGGTGSLHGQKYLLTYIKYSTVMTFRYCLRDWNFMASQTCHFSDCVHYTGKRKQLINLFDKL